MRVVQVLVLEINSTSVTVAGNFPENNQLCSPSQEGTKDKTNSTGRLDTTKLAISVLAQPAPVPGAAASTDAAARRETTVQSATVAIAVQQEQLADKAAAKRRKSVAAVTGGGKLANSTDPVEQSQAERCLPSSPLAQADLPARLPAERATRRRKSTAAPAAAATQAGGLAESVEERHVTFAKEGHLSVTEEAHMSVTDSDDVAAADEAPKRRKSVTALTKPAAAVVPDASAAAPVPLPLQVNPLCHMDCR